MRMYQEKISIFNAFIVAVVFYLVATPVLYAARENIGVTDPCASATAMSSGCATVDKTVSCYNGTSCTKKESCGSCSSGYTKTLQTLECNGTTYSYYVCKGVVSGGGATVYPGVVYPGTQYPIVVKPGYTVVDGCGATECVCDAPWDWTVADNGVVESKQTYTCNKNTNCKCDYTTEYRCVKGYYGEPKGANDTDNCDQCPKVNGVFGTTAAAGKTKVTDCYIPSTQSLTDDIGTYKFSTQCNAKNVK